MTVTAVTEDQLQAKCYQWAYNKYPKIRGLLFSVPNGGTRNIREAMKLKATGLTPGIPDIVLAIGPVGFEFKTDVGVLSPAQIRVHAQWKAANIPVHIIRSFDQWQELIIVMLRDCEK